MKQTDRVIRFIRDHPGASSWEITVGTGAVNVTGRVSDARAEGHVIECKRRADKRQGYYLRGDGTLGLIAEYRVSDYGHQLAAKGGRMHPEVESAIADGGGWPSDVPIPDPLTFREEIRAAFLLRKEVAAFLHRRDKPERAG